MNRSGQHIIFILVLLLIAGCHRSKVIQTARLSGDRLELKLDRKCSTDKMLQIGKEYGIDSSVLRLLLKAEPGTVPDSIQWKILSADKDYITIFRNLSPGDFSPFSPTDVLLISRTDSVTELPSIRFGVNSFSDARAVEFNDTTATFMLKGHSRAETVFLSGSFNGWSTMTLPMQKVTIAGFKNGKEEQLWKITIRLLPGKYTYKYIVDGSWISDPLNLQKERQEGRGVVSVFFMPDKIFELSGKPDAKHVVLTGSFIDWNRRGVSMQRSGDKWVLPVYLSNGTWAYKYIADGEWLTDPSNSDARSDASGNMNSFISIGEKHLFKLKGYTDAENVILTGSFNNWDANELLMQKDTAGWELEYALDPGNWEYKFRVDGEWMPDPENPYLSGKGEYTNSVLVLKGNYIFILEGYQNSHNVIVTGTFNGWNPSGYRMIKNNGRWSFPVHLKPGKYLYKFIIDDSWILDPANENWEDNEYGTGNSILWIGK